ncbi:MAG: antibiotic biosynthesis monooxygenase [Xanthobacteraceae bacterium]|nr:antibiotic biosynthesis monooxygenase [Xanthobacteraceae bacterium]
MKIGSAMLVAGAIMISTAPAGAQAPPPAPAAYAVTYLEIAPASEGAALNLIKQVAAASRKEAGNVRFEVLQRLDRKNQFAILEAWSDPKAREAHENGPAMTEFRDKLKSLRSAPYDERPSLPIAVTPGVTPTKGAVFVITHVDVTPNVKDNAIEMLKKLSEDARKEPGLERIEAWQQNNRANHFTLMEVWKDPAALEGHVVAPTTKDFREKLGPMSGALYDDRRYSSIE